MNNQIFFYESGKNRFTKPILDLDARNDSSYSGSGSTWFDLSNSATNGTLINSPVFNSGPPRDLQFTSALDKYVNVGSILNFTSSNFSFIVWVKFNALTTDQVGQGPVIFFKGRFNESGYYCFVSNLGSLGFHTNQTGSTELSRTNNGKISTGIWYCLGISRSGSSVRIFINGLDNTDVPASHVNPTSSILPFTINKYETGASSIHGDASYSVFRSFDKKLEPSEFLNYFNSTKSYFGY